jgi:hypothetical protein
MKNCCPGVSVVPRLEREPSVSRWTFTMLVVVLYMVARCRPVARGCIRCLCQTACEILLADGSMEDAGPLYNGDLLNPITVGCSRSPMGGEKRSNDGSRKAQKQSATASSGCWRMVFLFL